MKRFCVLFMLFVLIGSYFAPDARAADLQYNPVITAEQMGKIVEDAAKAGKTNKEIYSLNSQALQMNSLACLTNGCSSNPQSIFYYGKSPLAMIGGVIAGTYSNPPASMAYWIQDVGHDLGFLPKPAYAQGVGFSGFSGLLPLWKIFRNVAYFLLAAIMVVVGFMVMFRRKIDPKTVVTVQNALPRIVLTLLLITFSYAIVGFLIDIMYVFIYIAVSLFIPTGLLQNPGPVASTLAGTPANNIPAFYAQGNLVGNLAQATSTLNIFRLFGANWNTWQVWIASTTGGAILFALGVIAGGVLAPVGGVLFGVGALAVPVLQTILGLAMLFLFIRLLIFFLGAYIQVVIAMLFGPIQILFEAIPGTNSFASWLQNLIANLAVFPVGVIFFMLSAVFAKFANQTSGVWAPGLAMFSMNTTSISSLVSFGILFAIPTFAGQIKEALKAKPFVGAGPEGIAGAFGQPISVAMQLHQMIVAQKSMQAFSELAGAKKEKPA